MMLTYQEIFHKEFMIQMGSRELSLFLEITINFKQLQRLHSLLRMPSSRWFNCFIKPSLPCSALERVCSSENRCVHMASPKRQCLHKRFLS